MPIHFKKNNKNDVAVKYALFLAAQAVLIGVGKSKETSNIAFGVKKAQFTSTKGILTDLGVINVLTA